MKASKYVAIVIKHTSKKRKSRFPNSEIPEQALFMVASVLLHKPGVVFESVYPLCHATFELHILGIPEIGCSERAKRNNPASKW